MDFDSHFGGVPLFEQPACVFDCIKQRYLRVLHPCALTRSLVYYKIIKRTNPNVHVWPIVLRLDTDHRTMKSLTIFALILTEVYFGGRC